VYIPDFAAEHGLNSPHNDTNNSLHVSGLRVVRKQNSPSVAIWGEGTQLEPENGFDVSQG
jgi:hypothetical protein|tara:strand:+ start:801 stop:980 length:180 start_codon:yes stop_codon:yes gene_type:complete